MYSPQIRTIFGAIAAFAVAPSLFAQETSAPAAAGATEGGSAWLIMAVAAIMVMFVGLVARELGFSHSRNSVNVIMKALLTLSIAIIAYLFVGFGLMYVSPNPDGLLSQVSDVEGPFWSFFLVQAMIVAVAAFICSGATGERFRFGGYLFVIAIFSGLAFPMIAQFVWGSQAQAFGVNSAAGWLETAGFHDFSGGIVIHLMGGAFALAGALALGPRAGRFANDGSPRLVAGHSVPLAAAGVFLLWIGWLGLAIGQVYIRGIDPDAIGRIAVNLCVGAGFASVIAVGVTWGLRSRPDATATLNGALTGLVAVSAAADILTPAIAAAVGACASLLMLGVAAMLEKAGVDDVVNAGPVHLVGGIVSALAVAAVNPSLITIQAIGALVIAGITFALGFVVFKALDLSLGVRASDEEQATGLDFSQHAAAAYPESFESNDAS
ncbi:MAG: hypothetical protein AAF585_19405 [Verrucomicrobiota bacterium]